MTFILPPAIAGYFSARGWAIRPHQSALARAGLDGRSALLTAPTGGGKTMAGFLASLIELGRPGVAGQGLHTLYLSPLKALAVDIERNLTGPALEMGLDIAIETRTGDTPTAKRKRQRDHPPDMLLTTPEQVALLLSMEQSNSFFATLKAIVVDEVHAMALSKRGDLLALGLSRLARLAPDARRVGLSATVNNPHYLARWLVPQPGTAMIIQGAPGPVPEIMVLATDARIPWAGHMARHAIPDVLNAVAAHQCTLIFVNTRAQAELLFQELWRVNDDNLPIALHHGSLSVEQRRKVEAAMGRGELRGVVCTSTLDLGIDWGAVDMVVHVGAPKGSSRLLQRIGRANHHLDAPSRALLVPANRFEVLECAAARDAAMEGALDGELPAPGALDVLCQHILGLACSGPILPDEMFGEITSALPYADLPRATFDDALEFVATGGRALAAYDRYRRLRRDAQGRMVVVHPRVRQAYRMNVGTIVEQPMVKVRLVRAGRGALARFGRVLGEIEEYFIDGLVKGDTFLFGGEILAFEGMGEDSAYASRTSAESPKIPSYAGGKFPLSTYLAERVRTILADKRLWQSLPHQVSEWLGIQAWRSVLPAADQLLVETFPRNDKYYLIAYPFEGRLAHQTLGMLLTRRLERLRLRPMGFVASEYSLGIWALGDLSRVNMAQLFDQDMLGDDLDAWLAESALLKRTFRNCAVIAGLVERRYPGQEKTGRQVTISTDLIYDVLHRHQPDHILLRATFADAAHGQLDIARLGDLLRRAQGHILHQKLDRVSPLAVPALLDIGKVPIHGQANEDLLASQVDDLIADATRLL
jgi:ATP-dependent Lhr-like helicase